MIREHLTGPMLVALFVGQAHAQAPSDNLEERIEALETSGLLKDARIYELELSAARAAGAAIQDAYGVDRRGLSSLGQTTIFDNAFNPALNLIGDFVGAYSDQDDNFESHNQFLLRDVEIGIVGRVDPRLSYQLYVHFAEDEIEVEEAYLNADNWLPGTFWLKAGRMNLDFGKLSPLHEHDLPFVDKPQVLQEYLGGSLRGTGLELHHYTDVGEATLLRWSAAVVNGLDGDAHAVFGPAASEHEHSDDGPEPFGERDSENLAFNARLSALTEVGDESTLQVGASIAHAPAARSFFDTGTSVISADLQSTILGIDVTCKQVDPSTGRGLSAGVEYLHADNESSDDGVNIASVSSNGFYGYVDRIVGQTWSYGASGGMFEHAEDNSEESWDAGAFLTYRANEFNRLRLEARHFDDPGESSFGVMFQWTIILGSHGHGIDW